MIGKIYLILRRIIRKSIFLFLPKDFFLINYFVNFDIFIRNFGILDKMLTGSFIYKKHKFFYDKNSDKSIASSILTNGYYEKETYNEIRNNLFDGAVFIDGGANIGFYSILSSKFVGLKGNVISFEPTSSCYKNLIRNIKINNIKNIFTEKKAISNKNKKVLFKINKSSEENAIIKKTNLNKNNIKDTIQVQSISIDSYCKKKKIKKIDLIKLDIEGQELEAIKGAKKIIENNKNIKIIFELNIAQNKKGILRAKKIFKELKNLNFNSFKLLLTPPIVIKDLDNYQNIKMLKKITNRYNVNILAFRQF